ncbi:MAG: potassium channel family protein [Thermoleophilaceae bacterium]
MRRSDQRELRPDVELPGDEPSALATIGRRVLLALALIVLVAMVAYLGRDGYVDPEDDTISVLDAFYYSTVSITTTGYGDIRPVSDEARLLTTIVVTPARILFLILLVGTTLEVLAERSREAYRRRRWRKSLRDHTIICGFGIKGRMAAQTLIDKGVAASSLVAIDPDPAARARATAMDIAVIAGNSSETHVLEEAGIREAKAVVVAVNRDDSAVLTTLTARELNARASIVAAVREEENAHLLHQSGAGSVITSSGAAGRLLGVAATNPHVTDVLEDLLSVGSGLDVVERAVAPEEVGPLGELRGIRQPIVAIVRNGELLRFDDARAAELLAGDSLVLLESHKGPRGK